ncbi:MAG TPA: S8 family serine peptidase [Kofleriaceae bacterium]|nr:S8 family serine peptidase [Kofleriaceae bacterium]
MRTRLLYLHLLLASTGTAVVFAGCSERGAEPAPPIAPPGGVSGKSIVETPLGPAVEGELVVRLAAGPVDAAARELAAAAGGELVWRGARTGAYLIRFADAARAASALARLARDPAVAEVRHNLVVSGTGFSTSPGPIRQWNLRAMSLSLSAGWGEAGGVRVAVLDTGVAYEDHGDYLLAPDLAGVEFSDPYDFVNDDEHANDDNGHGTHVTGIIASTGPLLATAPGAGIIPIKVLGADNLGTELGLAEGLLHAADSGADVINLSLSFAPAFFPSRFLQDAVDQAAAGGAVMVAAVGNHARAVVTYPAAFRDVIAVSASTLDADFAPASAPQPWQRADQNLVHAAYANRGYLVDVTAPGGSIDLDIDGDDNPEAILAQSFAGDPTEFEYVNYAGTSQAAAQVSGLAAVLRAEHPELSARHLRDLVGETAHGTAEPLEPALGRGLVSARDALVRAGTHHADLERPRFAASIHLALHDDAGGRFARATVDLVDAAGQPAAGVEVYGSFTGGVFQAVRGRTDGQGRIVLSSRTVASLEVVGFQVEAVVAYRHKKATVDRPGGAVRIDSCSLELLSEFAEMVGSGFSTSPSPISLVLPALSADEVASVRLLNFSWSGATPAMAVVADRAWFDETYPEASEVRVTGLAGGLTDTALRFSAAESFPVALDDTGDECVDLVVGTYGAGFSTSPRVPVIPDPDGSCQLSTTCDAYRALIDRLWLALAPEDGGAMPTWSTSMGLSEAAFEQMVATMAGYLLFAGDPLGSPVGEYAGALEAAGIGATPYGDHLPGHLGAGSALWQ